MSDRTLVESPCRRALASTVGKGRNSGFISIVRSGNTKGLDKTSQTDRDLAVKRIGLGQPAIKVAIENRLVRLCQVHNPWLPVVRVGSEDGPGKRFEPDISFNRPRFRPGCQSRLRLSRQSKAAGSCSENDR